jgi:hypothetical protein
MFEYQGPTDQIKKVELPSSIQQVVWTRPYAAVGAKVGLEVFTQFVGNNSEIKIEISDNSGKKFETIKAKISGNKFWKQITVPEKAKDELYAEVKLPKHGLNKKSNCMYVYPPVQIKNCKWDKKEARRGDILKLTADVLNVYEGTEAEIQIWEHDADEAHDLITKFPVIVKNEKVEAEWEYEYHEDTDDIPTEEETEKGYNPPEYFFRVNVAGVSEDSELLEFKDWIELELLDEFGDPIAEADYVVLLADETKVEGKLDKNGYARVEDVVPGPFWIHYPEYEEDF